MKGRLVLTVKRAVALSFSVGGHSFQWDAGLVFTHIHTMFAKSLAGESRSVSPHVYVCSPEVYPRPPASISGVFPRLLPFLQNAPEFFFLKKAKKKAPRLCLMTDSVGFTFQHQLLFREIKMCVCVCVGANCDE